MYHAVRALFVNVTGNSLVRHGDASESWSNSDSKCCAQRDELAGKSDHYHDAQSVERDRGSDFHKQWKPGGSGDYELGVFVPITAVECGDVHRTSFATHIDCNAARRQFGAFVADQCEWFSIGVLDECQWRNVGAVSCSAGVAGKQFYGYERFRQ